MRREIITDSEFKELIELIKEHGGKLAHEEKPDPKFYLHNGDPLWDLTDLSLQKKYPGIDEDDREMFCKSLCGYVQNGLVMLAYFENKDERDYFTQKVLKEQTRAQELLNDSVTRATNMRNIARAFDLIFMEGIPDEYHSFVNAIKQRYSFQLKTSSEKERYNNAKHTRELVYDFLMKFIS